MRGEIYSGGAVRRAAWQFLSGKAASALLTFVILLWLVRLLPVAEYGAYVVLIAGTELGFAVGGLGLAWLAARDLPDYRLHADGPTLIRLCWRLLIWQALALVVLVAAAAAALDAYLTWAGLAGRGPAAGIALALLVMEGMGRFLREGLMGPLMLQGQARASLILRQAVFLVGIATLSFNGEASLIAVLLAEAGAAVLGTLATGLLLAWHLRTLRAHEVSPGWRAPRLTEQWRMALRMYGAHVITMAYGPQVFLNLVQRALGAEAAALFGFLRILQEQVARYLPATLLFTVLRPKLMASYLQGGMGALARQANLAGKLSLVALIPLILVAALAGDALLELLSGQRFTAGGAYLLGLLLVLLPFSQRQLLETVAVAAGRPGLCVLGSALGLAALPLMPALLEVGLGLWAPVLAMLFGQLVFNATVLTGLKKTGYQTDWEAAVRLAASALLAGLVASGVLFLRQGLAWHVFAVFVAVSLFFALAWWLGVFTQSERQSIDYLMGRRLLAR